MVLKSKQVLQLLPLLDELISIYHMADGEVIPVIDATPSISRCDFCGGELFFALFRCATICTQDEVVGNDRRQIIVCIFCYVDGRSCDCQSMQPHLLRLGSSLPNLRNDLVLYLRGFSNRGVMFEKEFPEPM